MKAYSYLATGISVVTTPRITGLSQPVRLHAQAGPPRQFENKTQLKHSTFRLMFLAKTDPTCIRYISAEKTMEGAKHYRHLVCNFDQCKSGLEEKLTDRMSDYAKCRQFLKRRGVLRNSSEKAVVIKGKILLASSTPCRRHRIPRAVGNIRAHPAAGHNVHNQPER